MERQEVSSGHRSHGLGYNSKCSQQRIHILYGNSKNLLCPEEKMSSLKKQALGSKKLYNIFFDFVIIFY